MQKVEASTMTIRGLGSQTNMASRELWITVQVLDHLQTFALLHKLHSFWGDIKYPCERLDSRLVVSGADYNGFWGKGDIKITRQLWINWDSTSTHGCSYSSEHGIPQSRCSQENFICCAFLAQQKDLKRSYFSHNTHHLYQWDLQWKKTPDQHFEDNPIL